MVPGKICASYWYVVVHLIFDSLIPGVLDSDVDFIKDGMVSSTPYQR